MAENYKNATFDGSTFPGDPYRDLPVHLTTHIVKTYQPALDKLLPNGPKGLKLLLTIMANTEGFKPGSRSYDNNNPGNIGNTDNGKNKKLPTLEAGIQLQIKHLQDIAAGKKKAYPMGKAVHLRYDFSPEIENNKRTYGAKSGHIPGYRFVFTGQLDQFVKIYATLPRVNNVYINTIVSYFKMNGLAITPESKLQDIILLDDKVEPVDEKGSVEQAGEEVGKAAQ